MTRLFFVRHGESEHAVAGVMGGWTDSALTARGERQAAAVAARISARSLPADAPLYSSDLRRARQTAAIIGRVLDREPILLTELREIHTGAAAGLPHAEVARVNDPEPATPDPDWRPNATAETYREMSARLRAGLARIERAGADTAIVVGHGLSGQELLKGWLGLPMEARIALRLDAGSLTELTLNHWGERQIEYLNLTVEV